MIRRLVIAFALLVFLGTGAFAQEQVFQADPAQSRVEFTLGDVFHTVHGSFQLKSGTVRFDSATGAASGELVVDAASGDSGSKARDRKMKRDILETDKYPDIIFTVQRVAGSIVTDGASSLQLAGIMTLHGRPHPMEISVPVRVSGEGAAADAVFIVPYVQWGLKNPSTLFLRVSDKVNITVHAVGRLTPCAPEGCASARR